MKLTEHFTKDELIYSDTANKYHIDNEPNDVQLKTLIHTCEYFLEPLRKLLNEEYITYKNEKVKKVIIKITSGFRCVTLNRKIGSKDNSQHVTGEAVDFDIVLILENGKRITLPHTETYTFIKHKIKKGDLSADQVICETSNGAYWVHASYKASGDSKNRKQFLIYKNGKYITD